MNGHGTDAAADVRLRRRYAHLLGCYPPGHRREHAEEMLEVLLATARPGQRWPRPGDAADLVVGAVRIRMRRAGAWLAGAASRGPEPLSSVVSLLAPVLLVAGAGAGSAHDLFWFLWYGDVGRIPFDVVVPDVPARLPWLVVLVLGLAGLRRATAVASWLAAASTAAMFVGWGAVGSHPYSEFDGAGGGWVGLAGVAAAACTFSAGPRRGLSVVGRRRLAVLCAAMAAVTALHGLRSYWPLGYAAGWMVLAAALAVTAVSTGRSGRRCSLVLAVVPITGLATALPAAQWSLLPPVGPDLALAALLTAAIVVLALLDTAVQHRRSRPVAAGPGAPQATVDPS